MHELSRLLPPRGLKPVVLERPSLFEIVEDNDNNTWKIKMKKRPTNSSNEQASTSPAVGSSMSSTDAIIGSWSSIIGSAICSGAGSQATARGSELALGGAQVETVTDENSTHEFQPARDSDGSAPFTLGLRHHLPPNAFPLKRTLMFPNRPLAVLHSMAI